MVVWTARKRQQAARTPSAARPGTAPSELLERAIGVIYLPKTEHWSHYFFARMAEQFEAAIHFGETCAVEPLERTSEWERGELPETYPSAV